MRVGRDALVPPTSPLIALLWTTEGERGRVARAEADVADTDHLRRFLLGHDLSFSLGNVLEWFSHLARSDL